MTMIICPACETEIKPWHGCNDDMIPNDVTCPICGYHAFDMTDFIFGLGTCESMELLTMKPMEVCAQ